MCRPTYYRIAYEINPWMRIRRPVAQERARRQWSALYALLTRTLKVPVALLPATPGVPDLVFTANAGLATERLFIRSNFRFAERQKEEPIIDRYVRNVLGLRLIRLPRRHSFEGEGDALWMGRTLLYGFRFRSDARVHERLSRLLGVRVLPVELADRRFYHLDTCFAPLDARTALWYPGAFDRYGRRVIERMAEDAIAVPERDAARFVCNTIAAGRELIVPAGASRGVLAALERRRFGVHEAELSEFMKAGGSAKCLVLRLPPRAAESDDTD
ncbi:MAG TPA: arginine deiminase-related protein [bacterium]